MKKFLLLAGWLVLAANCSRKPVPPQQPATIVTVESVRQKDVPVQIAAIGNARAFASVSVRTRIDGQLAKVGFRQGDEVKAGDLVFTIDPRPFEAAMAQAEAVLARDDANLSRAEADWKRAEQLEGTKAMSATALDQARANAAAAKATVQADRAGLENAKLQLAYCYIHSPVDGRVGILMVDEGNVVKNNDAVLAVINQMKPIYVDFTVPEQRLPEIRKFAAQQKLRVEASSPGSVGQPAAGELTVINNAVDQTTGAISLRATFPNDDERLWPGQFVNVALTITTQPNVPVVPTDAIQVGQQGQYLFIVKDDMTVEMRPITAGVEFGRETVVTKGVEPNEKVVVTGQLRLVPGAKVQIATNQQQQTSHAMK